jgi:DNA-binding protein
MDDKQLIINSKNSYYKQSTIPITNTDNKIFVAYICSNNTDKQEKEIIDYCNNKKYYLGYIFTDDNNQNKIGFNSVLNLLNTLIEQNFKTALIVTTKHQISNSAHRINLLRQEFISKKIDLYIIDTDPKEIKTNTKVCARFGEKTNVTKNEDHNIDPSEYAVVAYIKQLRNTDPNCKVRYIIEALNMYFPPQDFKRKAWYDTHIQRIINYYNIPGAKPNYVYNKNKNIISSKQTISK